MIVFIRCAPDAVVPASVFIGVEIVLSHSCQSGQHPHSKRGQDLYETPDVAVRALLQVEKLPHCIWEPAAGRGAIVRVLRDAGHAVIASDIEDYGFPLHFRRDFLLEQKMPSGSEAILTNPPFQIIGPFVARALALSPLVIVLARLALLESERRTPILDAGQLARVHVFRNRLPMMHRDILGAARAPPAQFRLHGLCLIRTITVRP